MAAQEDGSDGGAPPSELDLKGLDFSTRWEVIGAATPAAFLRADAPPSPLSGWHHESQQFSGMINSVKMRNGDMSRRSVVRAATASMPAIPSSAASRKYLRETGSPFRMLCKTSEAVQLDPEDIPRPDHVAIVESGLEKLWRRHEGLPSSPTASSASGGDEEAMRPSSRKSTTRVAVKNNMSPTAVMVTLSEFRRWCIDTFRDLEMAWNSFNPAGDDSVSEEDFKSMLKVKAYPQAEIAYQQVFDCLAMGKALTEDAFHEALNSVSVGRTAKRESTGSLRPKPALALDMDPDESLYVGHAIGGSALRSNQDKILDRLRRTDAPVAQLLEFMFEHFGTLKMAFRQLDLNGNGLLSSQEFCDGLTSLRSKIGSGPIEVHMMQLFDRLNYQNKTSVQVEELVLNLERDDDQVAVRFLKFTDEVRKKMRSDNALTDEASRFKQYATMLKAGDALTYVTRGHFCAALEQLRYPQWHAKELFQRLDKDDSGALSLAEFTAFLQKSAPQKSERKGPVVPLGTEHRRQQVENMYITCASSQKLAHLDDGLDRHQVPTLLDMLVSRKAADPQNRLLRTGMQRSPDGSFPRPDRLALVEQSLRDGSGKKRLQHTELSRSGAHILRGFKEPMQDLCGLNRGLADFDEHRARCRISAF